MGYHTTGILIPWDLTLHATNKPLLFDMTILSHVVSMCSFFMAPPWCWPLDYRGFNITMLLHSTDIYYDGMEPFLKNYDIGILAYRPRETLTLC